MIEYNWQDGTATIKNFGGRDRVLRMDFNALSKAEDLTGKNFMEGESWRKQDYKTLRALVYCCLIDDDPSLTLEQVGKMLSPMNQREISDAVFKLYIGEASAGIDDKGTEKLPFATVGSGDGQ